MNVQQMMPQELKRDTCSPKLIKKWSLVDNSYSYLKLYCTRCHPSFTVLYPSICLSDNLFHLPLTQVMSSRHRPNLRICLCISSHSQTHHQLCSLQRFNVYLIMSVPAPSALYALPALVGAQMYGVVCSKLGEVTQKCHCTKSRQQFWLFCKVWMCSQTSLICQKTATLYLSCQPACFYAKLCWMPTRGCLVSDWLRTRRGVLVKRNSKTTTTKKKFLICSLISSVCARPISTESLCFNSNMNKLPWTIAKYFSEGLFEVMA